MTDHTPFWDQLHDILQDELTVLRHILSQSTEVERAYQQNAFIPGRMELEEALAKLKKVQQMRFEKTKSLTGCVDLSLQDDYFSKWLITVENECEAASLWEQICTLLQKIDEQKQRNAILPMQMRAEEAPMLQKRKVDTIEEV